MAQHYQIYFVLLIVIFLSSNTCYAQFILEGDTEAFFDDGDIFGSGPGTDILGGTGTDFSALSALLPLLLLGPLLLAATTPTATAAQAAQAAPAAAPVMVVPVAPPQTVTVLVPAATTQCVSETCPAGFMVLPNQAISTNCYSDSGADPTNNLMWNAALLACTMTPGAYLWRPNTQQEADAVRNKYGLPNGPPGVWTGANDIDQDGTFRFAIENGLFDFGNLPFGAGTASAAADTDCVTLHFDGTTWQWTDRTCVTALRYICEYPRDKFKNENLKSGKEFVHREFAAIEVRPGNFTVAAWCNKNIEANFSFL
ncbi:Hypothetical predicted protein [Mytilus galloprovincialis]|uniref:C-type lectin domain-containing protein n=1 Tax=Mytilus galloprovincialis TaxID=29158 RepID=A0A8B6GL09_MYTGA|nr:Hypothetical predicted protein [Mytilus galloprovincialis]